MSIFVSPTNAPKAKTRNIQTIGLFLAGLLVVLAAGQLFSFEVYPERLIQAGFSGVVASFLATGIVVTEVLALPFILGMRLSPAFRLVSMVAGWVASVKLLGVAVVENSMAPGGHDAVFGATLPLPVGIWAICLTLALCVLVGWISWGMWPFKTKK